MPRLWAACTPNALPIVWARLAQHRFRVLIDTGAARSIVASAVASSLGLPIIGTERIIGVTGNVVPVPLVEMHNVGIAALTLPPFQAGVLELGALRLGIQAILGVDAFVGRRLQIDFHEGRVYCL
jgi:predicted aspartyl protease